MEKCNMHVLLFKDILDVCFNLQLATELKF